MEFRFRLCPSSLCRLERLARPGQRTSRVPKPILNVGGKPAFWRQHRNRLTFCGQNFTSEVMTVRSVQAIMTTHGSTKTIGEEKPRAVMVFANALKTVKLGIEIREDRRRLCYAL